MRSERTQKQVMSLKTWNAFQEWMDKELNGCRHLFVVSSIPVVYVNSNLVEAAFGFLPGQQDLEDDFKDQWLSLTHKEERLRLIHRLSEIFGEDGLPHNDRLGRCARRGARLPTVGTGRLRQREAETSSTSLSPQRSCTHHR